MSETVKRFLGVATIEPTVRPVEIAPAQLPVRSLASIAADINQAYADLEAAALTAVEKAIKIGKGLNEAKAQLKHGEFVAYVTANHRFKMSWGQRCMKLANHEAEINQEIERLRTISSHLSLDTAFKHIGSLNPRPKLKRKKPKPT